MVKNIIFLLGTIEATKISETFETGTNGRKWYWTIQESSRNPKIIKFEYTSRGCLIFRKLCKFAMFYSSLVLLAAITATWTSHGWRRRVLENGLVVYFRINTSYIVGWLGNVQRFITLQNHCTIHYLKPLFYDVFASVVVCIRSLLPWSIKNHNGDLSVICLPLYLRFKPRRYWNIPSEVNCAACRFPDWKNLYHSPTDFPGNSAGILDGTKISQEEMFE